MTDGSAGTARHTLARLGWGLATFALVAIWGVLLFQSDWKVTDRLLGRTIADLREVHTAAGRGELSAGHAAAERALANSEAASTRTDGPVWWVLGLISRYGPNLRAARQIVKTAEATADLAVTALSEGGDIMTAALGARCPPPGGAVAAARARLAAIDLTGVVAAAEALRALDAEALPRSLAGAHAEILARVETTISAVQEVAAGAVC